MRMLHLTDFSPAIRTEGTAALGDPLGRMDYSTEVAARMIRRYALAITEFEKSSKPVLILAKPTNTHRQ